MEQQATLYSSSEGNNGRSIITPKNRRKSPGDTLGSGKSQLPITRYYSPVSSSSDRSSQPYTPIACSSRIKRRISADSPQPNKRVRHTTAAHFQKQQIVIVSSDESSDELFTNSKPRSPAVVPKSRLSQIKRRLYPVTSSPVSSGRSSSRPKKKLLPKTVPKRRSTVLSDSDSEGVVPMENSRTDPKTLLDLVPQSSQAAQVRRRLCPEISSQAVIISSSDDSDFELHNSKQSQSFLSQSFCGQYTPKSGQKTCPPSQTTRSGYAKTVGSSFVGKPPSGTQKFPIKRHSLGGSSDYASLASKGNEVEDPLTDGVVESKCVYDEPKDDATQVPYIPVHNGDVSSVYLQDTIPLPSYDASVQPETDEADPPDTCKSQLNSSTEQDPSRNTAHKSSTDSSSHHAAVSRSPSPDSSIYNEKTIDPGMSPEAALDLDATVDFTHGIPAATAFPVDPPVDPEAELYLDATVDFSHEPSPNGMARAAPLAVDPETTIDAAVDFRDELLTNGKPNATPSGIALETSLAGCSQKGAIIEPSDDEDEPLMMQNQSDHEQVSKNGRTGLGVIPLSELLDVSHISGSDNDLSDIVHSDDDLSMIDESGLFSGPPDALAAHLSSLLVEGSDESSAGITAIMNSMVDASADFFSDVISSFDGSLEKHDKLEDGETSGKVDCLSPTEGIVNIALEVAGLEIGSRSVGDNLGAVAMDKSACSDAGRSGMAEEGMSVSIPEEASSVRNGEEDTPTVLPSCNTLPGVLANPAADSSMNAETSPSKSATEETAYVTSTSNGFPNEIKIVCGSQPSESTVKLHVTQNVEKTLLQNPNKLLLDTVIAECRNYAEHVLGREPIKSFVFQYTNLPQPSKVALHGCLLELLDDPNRLLKYQEPSAASIDNLVSSGIFEYLNKNDDLITKLNHLDFSEITDVLCKLGNSPSKSIETMRNIILNKFSSAYTCERVKKEVTDLINRKFVKLAESASFCIKICLELFVLPLNLCDKLYKTVEIAKIANNLIRSVNLNRFLLLPLRTSRMVVNADRVLRDLSDLCRLKSGVFVSDLNDESIYLRVNDICSSIAVLDVSAETDPSVKNSPGFRFIMANYVHALDEQLKTLLYFNTSNIEFGACIYLAVLLKQNVTGFQHKVKWCRERMRFLSKLFDTGNVFEEFSKVLKEPVTPVQFLVRSEFVSSALKIKKLGLSPEEKSHLVKLLRPISHKRTQLPYMPLNSFLNYYTVLTKKPKGKNFNMIRANIFEIYKSDFPCGVEDNGSLLLNAIFLTFWQVVYQNVEGMFLNKFQNKPLDWGSEEFFWKRENTINKLASEMKKYGLPAVFKLINNIFEQFYSHCSVVDWQLVAPNKSKMMSIVETLGLERFLKISIYVLGKLDERSLGFPDIVLWNPEAKTMKFLGLRKPADPLYPCQILWLEKLSEFELDAEELQMSGYTGPPEQCGQLE